LDVKGCEYSAVIDARWTSVANGKIVKLVLWYDNEWGYSSRVFDQLKLVQGLIERG
jgi:glyceraldehyde 3-phosphate dehydrogenase